MPKVLGASSPVGALHSSGTPYVSLSSVSIGRAHCHSRSKEQANTASMNFSRRPIPIWPERSLHTNTKRLSTLLLVLPLNLSPMLVFARSRPSKFACKPRFHLSLLGHSMVSALLRLKKALLGICPTVNFDSKLTVLVFTRACIHFGVDKSRTP